MADEKIRYRFCRAGKRQRRDVDLGGAFQQFHFQREARAGGTDADDDLAGFFLGEGDHVLEGFEFLVGAAEHDYGGVAVQHRDGLEVAGQVYRPLRIRHVHGRDLAEE